MAPNFRDLFLQFRGNIFHNVALQAFFHAAHEQIHVGRAGRERKQVGGGCEIFLTARGGETLTQSRHDKAADNRCVPKRRVTQQLEHTRAVMLAFALDGPPEQQRNVRVLGVFCAQKKFTHNRQRIGSGQTFARTGELAANL